MHERELNVTYNPKTKMVVGMKKGAARKRRKYSAPRRARGRSMRAY
jgi:hypothetical protein